jgi:hypothetical protein
MRSRHGVVLLLLVIGVGCTQSCAQVIATWTDSSSNWSNAGNWSTGTAPNNGGGTFYNAIINGTGADTITFDASGTVVRLRGDTAGDIGPSPFPSRGRGGRATTIRTISSDADTASNVSQRYGAIVQSIYATGVGRLGRNSWEAQLGQGGIAKITDETGGEYFALGTQNAVSFKPYLDRLQKIF